MDSSINGSEVSQMVYIGGLVFAVALAAGAITVAILLFRKAR
jgi:hypothetical protein